MKRIILCPIVIAIFTCFVFFACFYLAGEGFSEMREWTLVATALLGSVLSFLIAQDFAIATSISCTAVASVAIAATITGGHPMGVVIGAVAIIIGASAAPQATVAKEKKRFYFFLTLEALIIFFFIIKIIPKVRS